jgi:hypothetical protein
MSNGPKVYPQSGAGRVRYEAAHRRYEFRDYLVTQCPSCEVHHRLISPEGKRVTQCQMCGASLSPTSA